MWKYKGEELGLEGIIGVPATDLTDEEFAEYSGKHAFQFGDPKGLEKSGLWVHEDDKPTSITRSRGTTFTVQPPEEEDSNKEKADE